MGQLADHARVADPARLGDGVPGRHHPRDRHGLLHDEHRGRHRAGRRVRSRSVRRVLPGGVGANPRAPDVHDRGARNRPPSRRPALLGPSGVPPAISPAARTGDGDAAGMSERVELVRIAAGDVDLEIVPAIGARLHRLRYRGHDLLRTPPELERHLADPYFWGSYPMAPWCNRIAAGRTGGVAGRDLDLPASFPDGTAIHGQVSRVPWTRADDRTFRIRAGGDGWPWPYVVEQRFDLTGDAIVLGLRLTNLADDPMPAGLGIHPWFRRP